jgi:hypothetical protein
MKVNQRFKGSYRLQLKCRRVRKVRKYHEAGSKQIKPCEEEHNIMYTVGEL